MRNFLGRLPLRVRELSEGKPDRSILQPLDGPRAQDSASRPDTCACSRSAAENPENSSPPQSTCSTTRTSLAGRGARRDRVGPQCPRRWTHCVAPRLLDRIRDGSRACRRRQARIIKAFLDRYASQVQRFFDVPAGSPADAFRAVASRTPVFELVADAKPPQLSCGII